MLILLIWKDKFFFGIYSLFCFILNVCSFLCFILKTMVDFILKTIIKLMSESLNFLFLWIFQVLNEFFYLERYLFELRILRLFKWDISRIIINNSFDGPFLQFMKSLLNLRNWWRLFLDFILKLCIILFDSFDSLCFILIEFFKVVLFGRLDILYKISQCIENLLISLMIRYNWRWCIFILMLLLMNL